MKDSRRWPRIELGLDIRIRFDSPTSAVEARAINFSRDGLFVAMPEPEPIGTRVRVKLQIASTNERYTLEGIVVRTAPATGSESGVGVFLTATSIGWGRFCDRLGLDRAHPQAATPPQRRD